MIPKIIHFVWVGGGKKSDLILKCIESWKRILPDFEIVEWNDDSVKEIKNEYLKQALAAKKWAFASDYIRLYALKMMGGLYFDSDLEVAARLDDFMDQDFFTGYELYDKKIKPVTALMGAVKGARIVSDLLAEYDNIQFVKKDGTFDEKTNTDRISGYFKSKYGIAPPYDGLEKTLLAGDGVIYPYFYFCTPKDGCKVFSIHHFNGSWKEPFGRRSLLNLGGVMFSITKQRNADYSKPIPYDGERVLYFSPVFGKYGIMISKWGV